MISGVRNDTAPFRKQSDIMGRVWQLLLLAVGILLLLDRRGTDAQNEIRFITFPYLASVRLRGLHVCAATVLGTEWLVTAAHCVEGQLHEWLSAHVGSRAQYSGGTVHQVAQILIHPRYTPLTMDYNIALVKVADAMSLGPDVAAVPLATFSVDADTKVTGLGWDPDTTARVIEISTVQSKDCGRKYRQYGGITPRMFCLIGSNALAKNSLCNSGGGEPLLVNNSLVGVVSHGQGCSLSHDVPAVAVKVVALATWIELSTGLASSASLWHV